MPTKAVVGEDIRFVELNWRVDRPYVDRLRSGKGQFEETIYEVRHTVIDIEYRTLFFVYEAKMILVHFFKKTSQKTPKSDLDLGWDRMKKWVHAQKAIEQMLKKGKKSHEKKSNPHTGSSFNDFLENEGLDAEVAVT
ncbi:MAG: type II toxin-antitoxin system RelE/ParE family toxin [Pseudobdellovibrionaceae bacterium]